MAEKGIHSSKGVGLCQCGHTSEEHERMIGSVTLLGCVKCSCQAFAPEDNNWSEKKDQPDCPHCGYVQRWPHEWRLGKNEATEIECENCGQTFEVRLVIEEYYRTRTK